MGQGGCKILLVDDEPDVLEFLSYNLKKIGFTIITCDNGKEAIKIVKTKKPDLVLLDVVMPNMDGIEVCHEIRQTLFNKDVLIALLTSRIEDYSVIAGFDAGADDYIHKPISIRLLVSRINALLKRKEHLPSVSAKIKTGNLIVNSEEYTVDFEGEKHQLPKKEFELLKLLTSEPGNVFSRLKISEEIWKGEYIDSRNIDVHICKLRERFGDRTIKTIKGVGYKFENSNV